MMWDNNMYKRASSTLMSYVLRKCQVLQTFKKASSYSKQQKLQCQVESDSNSSCPYARNSGYNSKKTSDLFFVTHEPQISHLYNEDKYFL